MTVDLYSNASAPNTLYKAITQVGEGVTAQIKGACDIERPSLILSWKGTGFNYIHVSEWNRYYYVTSITALPGNMTQVIGQSDPLQSAVSQIFSRDALAVRNEDQTKWDLNEPDPLMITKSKKITKGYSFGSMQSIAASSESTYILGVI